jgi:hypothetical protein
LLDLRNDGKTAVIRASLLVNLWLCGFAVAFVLQFFLQQALSSRTIWGHAPGWQREIALWNISLIAAIFLIRRGSDSADKIILPALAVLSFLLGTNHFIAALSSYKKLGHWAGAFGNYLGVFLFLFFEFQ